MSHFNVPPGNAAISLARAGRLAPIDGKPTSPCTIWRWARKGKAGIRLRVWRRGRSLVTTEKCLREFEAAVAEADARAWADRAGEPLPDPNYQTVEAEAEALGI